MTKKLQALWEDLPWALLRLILECLSISDYMRFAGVCQSWRDVQRDHRLCKAASPRHGLNMPWIVIPTEGLFPRTGPKWLFYSPTEQRYYWLPLPEVQGKRFFCGISHGWLLLLDVDTKVKADKTVRNKKKKIWDRNRISLILVNPFTGHQILIPVPVAMLSRVHVEDKLYSPKAFITSVPTDPTCIVLLAMHGNIQLFCHVRDKMWAKSPSFSRIEFLFGFRVTSSCGNNFYIKNVLDDDLNLVNMDPGHQAATVSPLDMGNLPRSNYYEYHNHEYLVESEGQILLTRVIWGNPVVSGFKVYKADFTQKKWVLLETLGDRVLFLGHGNHFSMSADNMGGPGNHIYFATGPGFFDRNGGRLWIEYDYCSHRVVSSKLLPQLKFNGWERYRNKILHWIVPSLC